MAYIDQETALKVITEKANSLKFYDDYRYGQFEWLCFAIGVITEIPPADVEPIVYAEWIETEYKPYAYRKCSACGRRVGIYDTTERCPRCGAHMEKVNDG